MKKIYNKFFLLLGFILVGVILFAWHRNIPDVIRVAPHQLNRFLATNVYSEAECFAFWTEHLKPTVMDTFLSATYSIPEISHRVTELQKLIKDRFGQLNVNVYTGYSVQGHRVLASCIMSNGLPFMVIPIPAALDLFKSMDAEHVPGQREIFNLIMAIVMIHEMEHAAYGYMKTDSTIPSTRTERDEYEKRTWALTCEKSLTPLVDKYHRTLPPQFAPFYEHWVKAGRNVESSLWGEFIREVHKEIQ